MLPADHLWYSEKNMWPMISSHDGVLPPSACSAFSNKVRRNQSTMLRSSPSLSDKFTLIGTHTVRSASGSLKWKNRWMNVLDTVSPLESGKADSYDEGNTKLSSIEKQTILRVIEKNDGNITKTAKELGITRTALYRRLSKYDI